MKNNFGLILLNLVRTNKDKFLGLLRRNGVLVNTNVSNEDLANMILKAMQKSESFKKETILLMGVLMGNSDSSFSNVNGSSYFSNLPTFDENVFSTSTTSTNTTQNTTTNATNSTKKPFSETTVGTVFDKLFTLGNTYLTSKELDVRKAEADASQVIATSGAINTPIAQPTKSNTGLYVALALGGVALVGALVYLISKKK